MRFLLYGSYGYTGDLIAREAVSRGWRPLLGGRQESRLARQAQSLGLEYRVAEAGDAAALRGVLSEVDAVLNVAGPFAHTAIPMARACLATGTHYLDVTGELVVFQGLHALDADARSAGVVLMPGVGFEVVPSDCLAAHLQRRLPAATDLALAFAGTAGVSRGTALTMVEAAGRGGFVRRGGELLAAPLASRVRRVVFWGDTEARGRQAVSLPWADLCSAHYTTGIPNITTYASAPGLLGHLAPAVARLGPLLGTPAVRSVLKAAIRALNPRPGRRTSTRAYVWGQASDPQGRKVVSRLCAPEAYTLTIHTALESLQRVLEGVVEPGFRTPASAFGPDYVLGFGGVERRDG